MTPEKQRIAIAKACGIWPAEWPYSFMNESDRMRHVPQYVYDLNAMHQAEKSLTHDQHIDYMEHLGMCSDDYGHKVWAYVQATAAQRAEAFLRTIGKWEDDK